MSKIKHQKHDTFNIAARAVARFLAVEEGEFDTCMRVIEKEIISHNFRRDMPYVVQQVPQIDGMHNPRPKRGNSQPFVRDQDTGVLLVKGALPIQFKDTGTRETNHYLVVRRVLKYRRWIKERQEMGDVEEARFEVYMCHEERMAFALSPMVRRAPGKNASGHELPPTGGSKG